MHLLAGPQLPLQQSTSDSQSSESAAQTPNSPTQIPPALQLPLQQASPASHAPPTSSHCGVTGGVAQMPSSLQCSLQHSAPEVHAAASARQSPPSGADGLPSSPHAMAKSESAVMAMIKKERRIMVPPR